jgi:hypothetical protein
MLGQSASMVDHQRSPTACAWRAWSRRRRLGDGAVVRSDLDGRSLSPTRHDRIIEIDELAAFVEVDRRERERQAAPDEIRAPRA